MTYFDDTVRVLALCFVSCVAVTACGDDGDSASDPNAGDTRTEVQIAIEAFHPAGITRDGEGNLYVSGVGNQQIVRIPPNETTAVPFIQTGVMGRGFGGLLARGNVLWACDVAVLDILGPLFMMPPGTPAAVSAMVAYDLSTGEELVRHAMPGPAPLCNDLTFDDAGNIYISESFGHQILTIPAARVMTPNSAVAWSADPVFSTGLQPMGLPLTLNGITFLNGTIFANNINKGEVYRIPINADGTAGAVEVIVTGVTSADGMKPLADSSLVVVQNSFGQLSRIDLSLTPPVVTQLLPTPLFDAGSVEVLDGAVWMTETQLPRLLGADMTPTTPFRVVRFAREQLLMTSTFELRPLL